jgi:hypothetical protein
VPYNRQIYEYEAQVNEYELDFQNIIEIKCCLSTVLKNKLLKIFSILLIFYKIFESYQFHAFASNLLNIL